MSAFYYILEKRLLEIVAQGCPKTPGTAEWVLPKLGYMTFVDEDAPPSKKRKHEEGSAETGSAETGSAETGSEDDVLRSRVAAHPIHHPDTDKRRVRHTICQKIHCRFAETYSMLNRAHFAERPSVAILGTTTPLTPDTAINVDNYARSFYLQVFNAMVHICEEFCDCQLKYSRFGFFAYLYFNIFNTNYRDEYITIMYYGQRVYRGFTLLARMYRYRRANIHNTSDLVTTTFAQADLTFPRTWLRIRGQGTGRSAQIWSVWQNGSLFFFSQRDLLQLFNAALSHAPFFIVNPLPVKNPYNNVVFDAADVYNMWGFLREGHLPIPRLLYLFYQCHFCLVALAKRYPEDIREAAIRHFVINESDYVLQDYIFEMIDEFSPWMNIHVEFPQRRLTEIMRPYLYLFLCFKYNVQNTHVNRNNKMRLLKRMKLFKHHNHAFGRKTVSAVRTVFGKKIDGVPPVVKFIDSAPAFTLRMAFS
jgi:hypothetical protein